MYSKFVAILINSVFGICFWVYNFSWLALDIVYNNARFQKLGGGTFFGLSIVGPPILITIIIAIVIKSLF